MSLLVGQPGLLLRLRMPLHDWAAGVLKLIGSGLRSHRQHLPSRVVYTGCSRELGPTTCSQLAQPLDLMWAVQGTRLQDSHTHGWLGLLALEWACFLLKPGP